MPYMPKVGDIIQIRNDLEGCYDIDGGMVKYAGRQGRVVSVLSRDSIRWLGKRISFSVKLDIDYGNYHWYEDGLVFDPLDVFRC